jgi:hypothetical protein
MPVGEICTRPCPRCNRTSWAAWWDGTAWACEADRLELLGVNLRELAERTSVRGAA